jgi:hypothetical protein
VTGLATFPYMVTSCKRKKPTHKSNKELPQERQAFHPYIDACLKDCIS